MRQPNTDVLSLVSKSFFFSYSAIVGQNWAEANEVKKEGTRG